MGRGPPPMTASLVRGTLGRGQPREEAEAETGVMCSGHGTPRTWGVRRPLREVGASRPGAAGATANALMPGFGSADLRDGRFLLS